LLYRLQSYNKYLEYTRFSLENNRFLKKNKKISKEKSNLFEFLA